MTDTLAFDAIYDALDSDDIDGARRALERVRGKGTPHNLARAEAAVLGAEGNLDDAMDVLFDALEKHGEDGGTRVRAAETLLAMPDPREALACLEKALEDATLERDVATYARVMRVTALRQFGRYRQALDELGKIETESAPLRLEIVRERAELLAQLDRVPEALAALDAWAAAEPGDPEESWLRGVTLVHQGELAHADRAFDEARARGLEIAAPFRASREAFERAVSEAMAELGELADVVKGVPVEVIDRGVFVVDEEGVDGPYEHGVLELAYTLGAVDSEDSPVGKQPRKLVLVKRNLENAAGDEEGLREEIAGAIDAVTVMFANDHGE